MYKVTYIVTFKEGKLKGTNKNIPLDTPDIEKFIREYESNKRGELVEIEILAVERQNKPKDDLDFFKNIFKFK
jgi:hypothetical protein